MIEYNEVEFNDVSMFGDNGDRVTDTMMYPTIGFQSIMRYKPESGKTGKVSLLTLGCDYGAFLYTDAYSAVQDGARIQVRFDSTVKMEHRMNWVGLSGYIGGADDMGSESELILPCHDGEVDASTVIDVYVTGGTLVRRVFYITLYGTLDDATEVNEVVKQAVDGTTATAISLYTVPSGRILYLRAISISVRHIGLFAGKAYMVYAGLQVMAFELYQCQYGAMLGLVFPFWEMPIPSSESIGFRLDSFDCGNELIFATAYSDEIGPTFPIEDDVRNGIDYGPTGVEYDGDLVLPVVGDVKLGVGYGADGTEYTGTYSPGGGGGGMSKGRVVNQ